MSAPGRPAGDGLAGGGTSCRRAPQGSAGSPPGGQNRNYTYTTWWAEQELMIHPCDVRQQTRLRVLPQGDAC